MSSAPEQFDLFELPSPAAPLAPDRLPDDLPIGPIPTPDNPCVIRMTPGPKVSVRSMLRSNRVCRPKRLRRVDGTRNVNKRDGL
ncbi:hypothetical protein OPAG_08234 [Rhodococcus opacus PD630]|nr:hypothetical protein OPAG_08234 [Rhodococcus opacus PD630]